jgi:1-acyl-sn-glycerol-3-phosphate acyltransferase
MDVIPLNRNENDKTTSMHFKNRIAKGNLGIGMFPEGTWYRGFRKNRKIFPGAAVFARRYNLPILPIYLIAYNLNGKLELRIGELISNELSTEVISQKIREEFNRLYELNISKGDLLVTV